MVRGPFRDERETGGDCCHARVGGPRLVALVLELVDDGGRRRARPGVRYELVEPGARILWRDLVGAANCHGQFAAWATRFDVARILAYLDHHSGATPSGGRLSSSLLRASSAAAAFFSS
jgi:hypothetical protein